MRASSRRISAFAFALALAVVVGSRTARGAVSLDFLFQTERVTNDKQLFLNLTVNNYGAPRTVLEPVVPRLRAPEEDLPVVLFLAERSGRPVDFIVNLRARGLSWGVIFERVNVPPAVLFEGIERDPGPPYGRAWGYWRKHPKRLRLADPDIVALTHLQVAHRICGASPYELARARGAGRPIYVVVADKKGRHFHPGKDEDHGGHRDHGHGKGHGHGHGHGHGGEDDD